MLGSFPPPRARWCMDFFYPNRTNMMWEIFGIVFFNDASRLVDAEHKTFRQKEIVRLLNERGIAIFDTSTAVHRLQGNASDKYLEVVEKTDIPALLAQIPFCHDIVCTGQKSAQTLCEDCLLYALVADAFQFTRLSYEDRGESPLLPGYDAAGGVPFFRIMRVISGMAPMRAGKIVSPSPMLIYRNCLPLR